MGNNLVSPMSPRGRQLVQSRKAAQERLAWVMDDLEAARRDSKLEQPGTFENAMAEGRVRSATKRASTAQETLRTLTRLEKQRG